MYERLVRCKIIYFRDKNFLSVCSVSRFMTLVSYNIVTIVKITNLKSLCVFDLPN